MTKLQARDYLDVSLRTVERYLRSGRLPCTWVPVEGQRPRVEIAEEDVVALKAELDAAPRGEPKVAYSPLDLRDEVETSNDQAASP